MLPAEQRLSRRSDFSYVLKHGARASRPLLSVHLRLAPTGEQTPMPAPPRAGLVVSKAVGGSVVRHRTARRLRHLLRPQLAALPPGALVVVRAAPPAGRASSTQLSGDLDAALRRAVGKAVTADRAVAATRRPRHGRPPAAGSAAP